MPCNLEYRRYTNAPSPRFHLFADFQDPYINLGHCKGRSINIWPLQDIHQLAMLFGFSRHLCRSKSNALFKVTSDGAPFAASPHLTSEHHWHFVLFCWQVSLQLSCSCSSHPIPQSSAHVKASTLFIYMCMGV